LADDNLPSKKGMAATLGIYDPCTPFRVRLGRKDAITALSCIGLMVAVLRMPKLGTSDSTSQHHSPFHDLEVTALVSILGMKEWRKRFPLDV